MSTKYLTVTKRAHNVQSSSNTFWTVQTLLFYVQRIALGLVSPNFYSSIPSNRSHPFNHNLDVATLYIQVNSVTNWQESNAGILQLSKPLTETLYAELAASESASQGRFAVDGERKSGRIMTSTSFFSSIQLSSLNTFNARGRLTRTTTFYSRIFQQWSVKTATCEGHTLVLSVRKFVKRIS